MWFHENAMLGIFWNNIIIFSSGLKTLEVKLWPIIVGIWAKLLPYVVHITVRASLIVHRFVSIEIHIFYDLNMYGALFK